MKKTLSMAVSLAIAATCAVGVALPAHAADTTGATTLSGESLQSLIDTSAMSPRTKALAEKILAKLPADWQSRADAAAAKYGIDDSPWSDLRDSVINPDDYQCPSTELKTWARSLLMGAEDPFAIFMLSIFDGFNLPTYDALIFGAESSSNKFGVNGEYTQSLNSEMKNLKRFWDIDSADIELIPLHGADVFSSRERVARTLSVLYGGTPESQLDLADMFIELVTMEPILKGGANPIFSFNAFAYTEEREPAPTGISDRIVMGDGILQGMTAVGLGDVAPKAIQAHEFGHHVQYENDLFVSDLPRPEATRRTELMADAFGTYYLTHARGEALNTKRLLGSEQSFYEVGDCGFDNPGHHGTPNQRLAASTWAAGVANNAADQGHILPSLTFAEKFEAKLPDLVKPDAG
ncbi:hypothetical protein GCM10020367_41250 [Streptomyces sannanensis]|uniref:Uncharacterized protein n=1 Tax=Streptomyces sannanensis TaxID=285536 RepID=A0ABP6SFG6_9ACTN